MLAQVTAFVLDAVGVADPLQELHFLDDVLPFLGRPNKRELTSRADTLTAAVRLVDVPRKSFPHKMASHASTGDNFQVSVHPPRLFWEERGEESKIPEEKPTQGTWKVPTGSPQPESNTSAP